MMRLPTTDPTNHGNAPGQGPLRAGGSPTVGLPQSDANLPSTPSKAAKRQTAALEVARDLSGGNEKVKDRGPIYLPQAPGEDPTNYGVRLARSVFVNFFKQTVRGLTGMVMRRDPVLGDDVPEPMRLQWENIDNAGTHGAVFARELLQDGLTAGHAAILVEFPNTGGQQDSAAERRGAIRPYWVPIKKDNIVSWRVAVENGVTVVTQVVLKESGMVAAGQFGEAEQVRYRVLYRDGTTVGFRVLEVLENKAVREVDAGTYPTQVEIPLAEIVGPDRRSIFESDPPLVDLAYLNIAHYQKSSDLSTSEHKTCVPILFATGMDQVDDQGSAVVVGPNAAIFGPQGSTLAYVAHEGASLAECRASIRDLEGQMAMLGLAMLSPDKRVAETAEAKRIDKNASDSSLSISARGLQDGLERALGFHARYLRLEDGGSVTINRDFENLVMTPDQIRAWSEMVEKGQLTLETLWSMLVAGNALPDDFDGDQERAFLAVDDEIRRANTPAPTEPDDEVVVRNPDGTTKATLTRQKRAA